MQTRKSVAEISAYPIQQIERSKYIRLDLNESTRGCSPKVLEALQTIRAQEVCTYPDYQLLYRAFSDFCEMPQQQILFTNGADDAIRSVMQAFVDEGEEVVMTSPTFGIIPIFARAVGGKIRYAAYEPDWAYPFEKMAALINRQTKVVAIVRPDSPLGAVIEADALRSLLLAYPQTLFMLDETYFHFPGESLRHWTKEFPNLLVMQSFSKAYGLAGLRCGVVFAQPEIIAALRKIDPPFSLSMPGVKAILAAIEDTAFLEKTVRDILAEKDWLIDALQKLGWEVRDTPANWILVNFGETATAITEKLFREGILIKNLSSIPLLSGWCRISIGTRAEHLQLLKALQ
jgi:histidinol-phosphate aminotransferase